MQTLEKIQLSEEQINALDAGKMVSIPASWEEFEDFLAETDYRVEYHKDHIIIMGLARLIHEVLVGNLIYFLKGFYLNKSFYVAGSNVGLQRDGKRKHYNGDVVVIRGRPIYQLGSNSIITNPYLIVEVLSESTLNYDLGAKRRVYEQMESVQEIIFVDPFEEQIMICQRTVQPNAWLETTYSKPEELVMIDGNELLLKTVFENLPTEE